MSNEERILELLFAESGKDDDELSLRSGVKPRQQVNQICRRLEAKGLITRRLGPKGKILNYAVHSWETAAPLNQALQARAKIGLDQIEAGKRGLLQCEPVRTLFLVPCSASKSDGGLPHSTGPRLTDHLSEAVKTRLIQARQAVARRAYLNEELLRPALERYQGHFYQVAREKIREARGRGIHILIISGGYGALLPEEPIGNYEAAFSSNWWPKGLLSDVVQAYAAQHKILSVRAIVAASTTYQKAVASIDWAAAGIDDVVVVSPQVSGGGQ
ncbi:hypothetical protein AA309_22760 [Microvirga vignae]|uniref:Uncharacterized protein n=1 Tax=Microvirga vignae TaxID=1225564 RepID=A0A0H1R835_9HYPH|nr:hypothetical protein [Microvirga vignae]KLK91001.1 hypothetical protein AA309_22760 [Microvirga vignae]